MKFLDAIKTALVARLKPIKQAITEALDPTGSASPAFAQHTNPQRNRQRKTLKAMGRRQYIKANKAGRRAIKAQQAAA